MRMTLHFSQMGFVALLAEGVDRNIVVTLRAAVLPWSPSSRRAWIEIRKARPEGNQTEVALLAEGVDRNFEFINVKSENGRSPSSRRAWIEILLYSTLSIVSPVALLAEGVDRNIELPFLLCFEKSIALLTEGAGRNRHKNMVNSYYRKARN